MEQKNELEEIEGNIIVIIGSYQPVQENTIYMCNACFNNIIKTIRISFNHYPDNLIWPVALPAIGNMVTMYKGLCLVHECHSEPTDMAAHNIQALDV